MEISFTGKRALVTGASRGKSIHLFLHIHNAAFKHLGIGREIVKSLAKCGAHVIAVSRDKGQLGNKYAIKGKPTLNKSSFRELKGGGAIGENYQC